MENMTRMIYIYQTVRRQVLCLSRSSVGELETGKKNKPCFTRVEGLAFISVSPGMTDPFQ